MVVISVHTLLESEGASAEVRGILESVASAIRNRTILKVLVTDAT